MINKMINLKQYIENSSILEALISENKVVSFKDANGRQQKFGQCIILGGGPGIGKGFIRANYLDTDYKIFNVDTLKKLYNKMTKAGIINDKVYDLKNRDDVSALHNIIKDKKWKFKERDRMLNASHIVNKNRLPNICFDITAKDPIAFKEIFEQIAGLGYEITFVWVIGNLEVAIYNNSKRSRSISNDILINSHNEVNKFIPELLSNKYPDISNKIDRAFICLSAGIGRDLSDKWSGSPVIEVPKKDNKFDYDSIKSEIEEFMLEKQPKRQYKK